MKKQLLASLVAGSILTTGAFAYGMLDDENMMQMPRKQQPMQIKNRVCDDMGMKYHKMNNMNQKMGQKFAKHHGMKDAQKRGGQMGVMKIFRQLALTQDQKKQVRDIFKNRKKDVVKLSEAFGVNGFDQAKYEMLLKQARDNRFKNQAAFMGKIYTILTDKQKAQFKTLLELHEERLSLPRSDFKGKK